MKMKMKIITPLFVTANHELSEVDFLSMEPLLEK